MNAEQARIKNIIDMAIGFSAMTRVFEKNSIAKISAKVEDTLTQIASSESEQDFQKLHHNFCLWFTKNIKTAEREKDGVVSKKSNFASYGQGAKILDVALQVFVHYCHLPSPEVADGIKKWLNSAVDTKMMRYLKEQPYVGASSIRATTIEQVDENTYAMLQRLVCSDINGKFAGSILPVEWDDIMWRKLNKKT